MKLLSGFCLALFLILASPQKQWGHKPDPGHPVQTKTYYINLDLPPIQKWAEVISDNKENIHKLIKRVAEEYPIGIARLTSYDFIKSYNPEYAEEISAIAQLAECDLGEVFWLNMMYEVSTFCTSIIIQDENNNIFHGRNLDWGLKLQMEQLQYTGLFYSNGSILFKASLIAGSVGFITGEKPGVFTISADQRMGRPINTDYEFHPLRDVIGLGINMYEIFENHRPGVLWTIRNALMNAESFNEAYEFFKSTQLVAPVYYILAGTQPGEGVVLTMNRDNLYEESWLDAENGTWYLVQTNYDRDLPDPKHDDRRTVAQDRLNAIGRANINEQNLFTEVLQLYPNNNQLTIETVLFSASTGLFNITVWAIGNLTEYESI